MIKFIFRWGFRLLILSLVLAGVLMLCKDSIIKSLLESRIRAETGMDVKIARFELGLFTPTVSIEGFKLYNTAQFGGLPLLDVPDLYIEYDRDAAYRNEWHFKLIRVNLAEINIVEDAKGQTLLPLLQSQAAKSPAAAKNQELQFTGIDVLNLSLGTIKTTSLANPAKSRTIRVGLQNEVLKNVKSVNDLSALAIKLLWQHAREVPAGVINSPAQALPPVEPKAPASPRK